MISINQRNMNHKCPTYILNLISRSNITKKLYFETGTLKKARNENRTIVGPPKIKTPSPISDELLWMYRCNFGLRFLFDENNSETNSSSQPLPIRFILFPRLVKKKLLREGSKITNRYDAQSFCL